jgi:hypothetical protein
MRTAARRASSHPLPKAPICAEVSKSIRRPAHRSARGDPTVAKGQKRTSKEVRKPKQDKPSVKPTGNEAIIAKLKGGK